MRKVKSLVIRSGGPQYLNVKQDSSQVTTPMIKQQIAKTGHTLRKYCDGVFKIL